MRIPFSAGDENMADVACAGKRGRKQILTDSGRKRKKSERNVEINKSKIYLGSEFQRWNSLKTALKLQRHAEVAKILLDRYEQIETSHTKNGNSFVTPKVKKHTLTSTPGPCVSTPADCQISEISEVSSAEPCDSDGEISGVETLSKKKRMTKGTKSNSFLNPFELSVIDISETETCDSENDTSDEDYEPSFRITLRPSTTEFERATNFDHIPDEGDSDEDEIMDDETNLDPGLIKITNENYKNFTSDQPFLVYQQCLMQLVSLVSMKSKCSKCAADVTVDKNIIGSALHLKWACKNGHVLKRWCSQPILNRRMHSGDLLLASSIILSGNNFRKVEFLFRCLRLPIFCKSTFHKIQRTYLLPTIDNFWFERQRDIINTFLGQDLVILGDGRMDSPGHSAQYCSYTFMEYTSKKVLCITTMDKRMTNLKSTNLEKACFLKGLQFLMDSGLSIAEIVTDAHTQIAALMRNNYPNIKHSFDIWHGTKNLGKKIMAIGHESDKKDLMAWAKDIMNHFWYTASISDTYEDFVGVWFGILHHVCDEHQWILPCSENASNCCNHGPLTEERTKGWLKKGSPAHEALRYVVMDKRRLNQVHYYLNCRSTAELENFQNLILVYASKRISYNPPTYRSRNHLAALDHNGSIDRETKINKDGSIRYQRSFNKKSGIWSVHEVKIEKSFPYIPALVDKIVESRLNDDKGMTGNVVLDPEDPRRISKTLAPIPPPPTQQLVLERKSRFQDADKTLDYIWDI